MRTSSTGRLVAVLLATLVALLVQVTVLPPFAWEVGGLGVVPDVVLLVVVATALATDTRYGTLTGFFAGLLLDLAPPADHVAGQWALALVLVGYVAGRVQQEVRHSALAVVGTVAASSFVGT
ncbi:MAG TPA: rod shape-determining protein MreD, partial [Nocardioides sp.]|nr:rod shape-determining protein MreD [Nocardioides sp.]